MAKSLVHAHGLHAIVPLLVLATAPAVSSTPFVDQTYPSTRSATSTVVPRSIPAIPQPPPSPWGPGAPATYVVSFCAILLIVLAILAVAFTVRYRKRRISRKMEEAQALRLLGNTDGEKSSRTSTVPLSDVDQLHFRRSIASVRASAVCTRDIGSAAPCRCPDCLTRVAGADFRMVTAPLVGPAPIAPVHLRPAAGPRMRAQPDENANRQASIRVQASPPLSPHEHEWQLLHTPDLAAAPFASSGGPTTAAPGTPLSPLLDRPTCALSDDGGATSLQASPVIAYSPGAEPAPGSKRLTLDVDTGGAFCLAFPDPDAPSPSPAFASAEKDLAHADVWLTDADWFYAEHNCVRPFDFGAYTGDSEMAGVTLKGSASHAGTVHDEYLFC